MAPVDALATAPLDAHEARLRLLLTLMLLARIGRAQEINDRPIARSPVATPRTAGRTRRGRGQPTRPPRAC